MPDEREQMTEEDRSDLHIAVVGMAARFAGANDPDTYWRNLRAGVESITELSDDELRARGVPESLLADPAYVARAPVLDAMEGFDAPFFGFSPREGAIMDPQHRHFLECAWEALESAGHPPSAIDGRVGVFAGNGMHAYMMFNLITNPRLMESEGLFLVRHTGNDKDFLATRVSYHFDLRGPSVSVQTACSTSLVAIHLATQSLLNGESDFALAGGVTIELPHGVGYLYKRGEILSPDGRCRPFDHQALGTLFGSGCGVVALRRLTDAVADGDTIHAVIRATAINNDGSSKVGYLAPSVDGQAQCITECIALADVSPESIGYVECHGTGTPVGDPIEITALTQAFRTGTSARGFCAVGSVKANIGHTDTAAGVASFIKVVQALKHREIPPTLNFTGPNPAIDWDQTPFFVNAALRPWGAARGPRRAAVNSLGVGGTNAHVILEEAPAATPSPPPPRSTRLLVFSGRTRAAVAGAIDRARAYLAQPGAPDVADVEWTLQVGRHAFLERRAVVCDSTSPLIELERARTDAPVRATEAPRAVGFMFAGGGAQYPNMGRALYDTEPVYRAAVDECVHLVRASLDYDLKSVMFPAPGREADAAAELRRPSRALPCLFVTQLAQARLWMSWGVEPSGMIGHSMGEYTAACLAGVFRLQDALAIVALRGRLFEKVPPGGMLSVQCDASDLVARLPPSLSLAAINAPGLSLASGPVRDIEALHEALTADGVGATRIHIDVAAHSAMLDPILAEFRATLSTIRFGEIGIPFVSNLSGDWADGRTVRTAEYWVRHLREPVRFAAGIRALLADPTRALLEVGPGRTLATLARLSDAKTDAHVVFSGLRHPDEARSDVPFMMGVLGDLWCAGVAIDWRKLHGASHTDRRRVPLPTYAWDHQHLWIEGGGQVAHGATPPASEVRAAAPDQMFCRPVWTPTQPVEAAGAPPVGAMVVLSEPGALGAAVVAAARARGLRALPVHPGRRFHRAAGALYVNPTRAEDARHLWRAIDMGTAVAIVDLRPCAVRPETPYLDARAWAFEGPLHLGAALALVDTKVTWTVVTCGAQEVAAEGGIVPLQALALGPATVAGAELPHVRASAIDVRVPIGAAALDQLARQLVAEALAPGADPIVALRGERRFALSVDRSAPPEVLGAGPCEGAVVITGGFGGLGMAAAQALSAPGRGIALLGRTGLPPRAAWAEWTGTHGPHHPVSRRIAAVHALEARGARVVVHAVDVADVPALSEVVRTIERALGPIGVVLHTAGLLDDGLMATRTVAEAERVLRPKVGGALALLEALGDREARIVLYSSISAWAGIAGQSDYAAANAVLNTLARAHASRGLVALAWPAWRDVGMAAELAASRRPLSLDAGADASHPLLGRHLRTLGNTTTFARTFEEARDWILDDHRLSDGTSLLPGTAFIEVARAAVAEGDLSEHVVELRDVAFLTPFICGTGQARTLRVDVTYSSDDDARVTMTSGGANHDQTRHVTAIATVRPPVRTPSRVDLRQIRSRLGPPHRPLGEGRVNPFLRFGPRWGTIARRALGEREALLDLELPEQFHPDLLDHRLHPAVLDFATAGAQALAGDGFYVPVGYGRLVAFRPLGRRTVSHVRLRPAPFDDHAVYDIVITDPAGRVLVEIDEFTMRRVPSVASFAVDASAPAVASAQGPAAVDHGLGRGVSTGEGLEALRRVLGGAPGPEVVVSPFALDLRRRAAAAEDDAAAAGGDDDVSDAPEGFVAPRTEVERAIARIWGDALGVRNVGAQDGFFELGGHSLVAIRIAARINAAFGIELSLRALFDAPTVARLAAVVAALVPSAEVTQVAVAEGTGPAAPSPRAVDACIEVVAREGRMWPAPAQEGLWFVEQWGGPSSAYNIPLALRLRGPLDLPALEAAVAWVVARHEATRMTFVDIDGAPRVAIAPPERVRLEVLDASGPSSFAAAQARVPFDLARGPLFRVAVGRLAEDDHVFVATTHHIVSDEWSLELFCAELGAAYTATRDGVAAALPALPVQYADYAAWQRQRVAEAEVADQVGYWQAVLERAPTTIDLPTDHPRPPVMSLRGARHIHAFAPDVASGIRRLAQARGVTMYVAMLSVFAALLSKLTGQDDLLIGTPASTRTRAELEHLIGFFINTLVVRLDVVGDPSFDELVSRTRAVTLDAFQAAEAPLEKVLQALAVPRDPSRNPLYQVMFALFPSSRETAMSGLDVEHVDVDAGGAPIDLTLYVSDGAEQLRAIFEYNLGLFEADTIAMFARGLESILRGVIAAPDQPLSTIGLVDDALRTQLVRGLNPAPGRRSVRARLHRLFEAQARRSPDAIAVEARQQGAWEQLTYAALDARATALAHHLSRLGAGPGTRVGVFLRRTLHLPVTLLAILKTGAAYLPLDPSFPHDRLEYMVADSAAAVVVSERALVAEVPRGAAHLVIVDDPHGHDTRPAKLPAGSPEDEAYIIYTSGSTGRPKGVMVPHRAAVNFLESMALEPGLETEDVVLAVTTISFDISVLELFLPLSVGARVVLVDKDVSADGAALAAVVASRGVRVMQATPATWRLMIQAGWAGGLRAALCGGEPLQRDLAAQLLGRVDALWNMYGPTETTVWSTISRVTDPDDLHIGRAIANTTCYVLDRHRQLVPPGVPGVLWIGGAGVTKGYVNRPELTGARFVADPFGGGLMYDTGDLVRWRRDGNLEYLSRVDTQVKVRGFRIELGEIEAVVARHPSVQRVVVAAHDLGAGDVRLAGYVVPTAGVLDTDALREAARARLPEYMVPATWVALDALPLTANGKIDRRALPRPGSTPAPLADTPALSDAERYLVGVWEELLQMRGVSTRDNFFDLGGHSLLAMAMIHRVAERTGRRFNPLEISLQTLAQLAASLPSLAGPTEVDRTSVHPNEPAPARAAAELDEADPPPVPSAVEARGARPTDVDAAEVRRLLGKAARRFASKIGLGRA